MTSMTEPIELTRKDRAILQNLLNGCGNDGDPLAVALQRKLAAARIVAQETISPDVVTLSSRVAFRINGSEVQTRVIVHEDSRGVTGLTLPLTHPRAMAMLGVRAGVRLFVGLPDGSTEEVTVVRVSYQPEAARRQMASVAAATPTPPKGAVLRLLRADNDRDRSPAG